MPSSATSATPVHPLSLHDALPISCLNGPSGSSPSLFQNSSLRSVHMPEYKAPLRDIRFVRDEVLGYEEHYQSVPGCEDATPDMVNRSEEHTSELQSRENLVCRLLLRLLLLSTLFPYTTLFRSRV